MRDSSHPIWAIAWVFVGLVTCVSPGCGCPRSAPDSPIAEAETKPDRSVQPMETTPLERAQPREERVEDSDRAAPPSALPEPGASTATAETTTGTTGSATDSGSESVGPKGQQSSQTAPSSPNGNPADAKRRAREFAAAATKSADKSNYAQAFREARKGWEAVSAFPNDAECQTLAKSLLQQMAQLGSKANAEVELNPGKVLVVE